MACDIVSLDPWKDNCPWCKQSVLIDHQLAVYDDGESEQFVGLRRDGDSPNYGLSKRELEVLALLASGYDDQKIAFKLNISSQTAKHHGGKIRLKLGTRNRTETAVKAVREGLV